MKGAQVTVQTLAKNKREEAPPAQLESRTKDDLLKDPLVEETRQLLQLFETESAKDRPQATRQRSASQPLVGDALQQWTLDAQLGQLSPAQRAALAGLIDGDQPNQAPVIPFPQRKDPTLERIDKTLDQVSTAEQAAQNLGASAELDQQHVQALAAQLLAQLSAQLGISPVPIRMDETAQQRLRSANTSGLMEQGQILLDPENFDPQTAEGRRLLAHEAVHVAQAGLHAPVGEPQAGPRAETEAAVLSRQFAAQGSIQQPVFGLPAGHMAADGDVLGKGLGPLLSGYHANLDAMNATKPPVGPAPNNGSKSTKEDRAKKVSRYGDGVDGIADEIGDLDAFDDLCDTIDDGSSKYMPHIRRIERTKSFQQLAEMWQGAKDGGPDSATMKKIFDYEFRDRGVFASTERAFDLVQARAKKAAKRRAEAAEAEKGLSQVAGKVDEAPAKTDAQGGKKGKNEVPLPPRMKIDPALADLMNATVEPLAPVLGSQGAFFSVQDSVLGSVETENTHAGQFTAQHGGFELENSRLAVVLETYKGGAGNMIGEVADGLLDDQVGNLTKLGDKKGLGKMLPMASKGLGKIMPVVNLSQDFGKLIDGETWTKKGDKVSGAYAAAGKKWDALDNSNLSDMDRVGLAISIAADVIDIVASFVTTAKEILSFIQDLLYVLGAILFAVGLALIWFFGVGIPFVTCGTWMLNTARILTPAVKVLSIIEEVLLPIALGLRTAAVFLVPSEFLAEEAKALGGATDDYAKHAGGKIKNRIDKKIKNKKEQKSAQNKAKTNATKGELKAEGPGGSADGQQSQSALQDKAKATADNTAKTADGSIKNIKADRGKFDEEQAAGAETADKPKSWGARTTDKAKAGTEAVAKEISGLDNNVKNKYSGDVKTAKDGRIYVPYKDKNGHHKTLWGKKNGDKVELQGKFGDTEKKSGWWDDKKREAMTASYQPEGLKNEHLFSFVKTSLTTVGVIDEVATTLAARAPALASLNSTAASFFAAVSGLIPKLKTTKGLESVTECKKLLKKMASGLQTAIGELAAAAASRRIPKTEFETARAAIKAWDQGLRVVAMQLTAAISGEEIPAELPATANASEDKRDALRGKIAKAKEELEGLDEKSQADQYTKLQRQISVDEKALEDLGEPKPNKSAVKTAASTSAPVKAMINQIDTIVSTVASIYSVTVPEPLKPDERPIGEKLLAKETKSAGAVVEVVFDEVFDVQTENEMEAMTKRIAAYEQVKAELPPPAIFDQMMEHRLQAARAYTDYVQSHEDAYMAFSAELAALGLAQDTDAMIEQGTPLTENLNASQKIINDARTQESSRRQNLGGVNTEMPALDSWIATLVVDIMMRFADNSDAFDGGANAGSANAGNDVLAVGKGSKDTSDEKKNQSLQASEAQSAFVESASQVQQAQLATTTDTIGGLRALHAQEMDSVTSLQLDKAQALTDRDAAASVYELHSGAFLLQQDAMTSWSGRYKSKREALDSVE